MSLVIKPNFGFELSSLLCQTFDFIDVYEDLEARSIKFTGLEFNEKENIGVSLFIEEKNKKLKRSSLYSQYSYFGPPITIDNLADPRGLRLTIKLSQTINTDLNTELPCVNYPTSQYESFGECDRQHVRQVILNQTGLIPFWTADNLEEVTKQR